MGILSWLRDLLKGPEEYGTPSVALTGQPVKSKGEGVIADYFTSRNVGYQYEAEATTDDWFVFKTKISRPDFYLPQYNLYVIGAWSIHLTKEQGTATLGQCAGRWHNITRTTSNLS